MVKVVYTRSVKLPGADAAVGFDKMEYEFKDVPDEATFQLLKHKAIDELRKEDSSLVKVSFYTETHVPFEMSIEDVDEEFDENCIDKVYSMTLEQVEKNNTSFTHDVWERFNKIKLQ